MAKLRTEEEDHADAEMAACKRADVERITSGQRIYARIERESKYYGQGKPGALYQVCVRPGDEYSRECTVQGGPDGRYRLEDVNLFVVEDGQELRIS
jgi:hypothetical protein